MELEEIRIKMINTIDEIIFIIEEHIKKPNPYDDFIKAKNILINKNYTQFDKIKSRLYSGFRMLTESGIHDKKIDDNSNLLSEYLNKIIEIIQNIK